ncbi:hypothetical protein AAMO2058_000497300 [Amorphochlora amoebiformis]
MDLKRMVQAERQAKGLNLRKLNELEALHEKKMKQYEEKMSSSGTAEQQLLDKLARLSNSQHRLAQVELELEKKEGILKIAQRKTAEAEERCNMLQKTNRELAQQQESAREETSRLARQLSHSSRTFKQKVVDCSEQDKFLTRQLKRARSALMAAKAESACLRAAINGKAEGADDISHKITEADTKAKQAEKDILEQLQEQGSQLEKMRKKCSELQKQVDSTSGAGENGEGVGVSQGELEAAKEREAELRQRVESVTEKLLQSQCEFRKSMESNEVLQERIRQAERVIAVQKQRISTVSSDRDNFIMQLKEAKLETARLRRASDVSEATSPSRSSKLGAALQFNGVGSAQQDKLESTVKSLQKELSALAQTHDELKAQHSDQLAASELNAASRHSLASSMQDITDLVSSFCKHHKLHMPKPVTITPSSPEQQPSNSNVDDLDAEEHLIFGKSESKIAVEAVRFLVQRAAEWVRDSRDRETGIARAKAEAKQHIDDANLELEHVRKLCEDKVEKLQAEYKEAFEREEAARRRAAKAEAAKQMLEEEHSLLVQRLEEQEQRIESQNQQGREAASTREIEIRDLQREVSRLKQAVSSAEQEAELQARQLNDREGELADLYEELKEANDRVATFEAEQPQGNRVDPEINEQQRQQLLEALEQLRVKQQRVRDLEEEAMMMSSLADDYAQLKKKYDDQAQEYHTQSEALSTMREAVEQMERDTDNAGKEAKDKMEEAEAQIRAAELATKRVKSLEQDLQQNAINLQKLERELTSAQRYVLKLKSENSALRKGYEKVMLKMRELSEDGQMIDRRLVVRLIVTYFEKGHSSDVLELMARMLQFTEEEKAKVGVGSTLLGRAMGWFSGFGDVDGAVEGKVSSSIEDRNLADMWVDFLMQETEAAERKAAAEAAAARVEDAATS